MFDDDAAIQSSSLGRQLLMLPVFGLSAADCTATALQLALHFENFPLFCHVASHIKKAHAADATSIVKAICDSGACQLSAVASPICCNFTDLSPGPSFSLPFNGDALFDCVVSLLSGTMHCVINVVRGGHHVIIDYVLPEAAKCNQAAKLGAVPVFVASLNGHTSCVQALLEAGADANIARTSDGATALLVACQHGFARIVELLLQGGSHVNHADNDGSTPIMMACEYGHYSCAAALVNARANLTSSRKGQTPLDVAEARGHEAIVRLITSKLAPACSGT